MPPVAAKWLWRPVSIDVLLNLQAGRADSNVLEECLTRAGRDPEIVKRALTSEARTALADDTQRAYANGIFGVPAFVCNNEVFFGNDRLDMLGWRLSRETART